MPKMIATILLSVASSSLVSTLITLKLAPRHSAPQSTSVTELDVERLIVRKELIVSDTGASWEVGCEKQQIARGLYARPQNSGAGGLWVRGRRIKSELDDPFNDRFHAMNSDGSVIGAPAHI